MDELRGPPIWETPAYKHHKNMPWHGQGEHTWDKTILVEQSPHQLPCHNSTWQDALPFATLLLQGWSVKITSYNAGKIIHYICCRATTRPWIAEPLVGRQRHTCRSKETCLQGKMKCGSQTIWHGLIMYTTSIDIYTTLEINWRYGKSTNMNECKTYRSRKVLCDISLVNVQNFRAKPDILMQFIT